MCVCVGTRFLSGGSEVAVGLGVWMLLLLLKVWKREQRNHA